MGTRNTSAFQHDKTAGKDEWLTPPEITNALAPFDLDPCSPIIRPWATAAQHYTVEDNGLMKPWHGFVWCNPPYGNETRRWIKRLADHGNGIGLIFARTDTQIWQQDIFPLASSILFIAGRLTFYTVEGKKGKDTAGAPSALIGFGDTADERIKKYWQQRGKKDCLLGMKRTRE